MKKPRIDRNDLYINMAKLMAKRSTCGRGNVGVIIVNAEYRIIASGYNGPIKSLPCEKICNTEIPCQESIHAEANAIYHAAKVGISLNGCILYCTHAPCKKCAEAIHQSGITKVYYLNSYRNNDGIDLLSKTHITIEQLHEKEPT